MNDWKICVLDQRWVLVGCVEDLETDTCPLVLHPSAVLRYWGTSAGLGELHNGPLPETKLDWIPGKVKITPKALIYQIEVDGESWDKAALAAGHKPR